MICGIGRDSLWQGTERNRTSLVRLADEQSVGCVSINELCTLTCSKNKELCWKAIMIEVFFILIQHIINFRNLKQNRYHSLNVWIQEEKLIFTCIIRICALAEVRIKTTTFLCNVLRHSYRKKASLLWAGYSVLLHFNTPFFSVVVATDGPEFALDRAQISLVCPFWWLVFFRILTFLCISSAAENMYFFSEYSEVSSF